MHIQWTDDLATGYDLVDEQHKELFVRLNNLIDAFWDGRGRQKAIDTLDFLGDYVVQHFATEEQLMLEYEYPAYDSHRAIHQAFIARFLEIKSQFNTEGMDSDLSGVVLRETTDWLQNHIRNVDKKMVDFVRAGTAGVGNAAAPTSMTGVAGAHEETRAPEAVQISKAFSWQGTVIAILIAILVAAVLAWLVVKM